MLIGLYGGIDGDPRCRYHAVDVVNVITFQVVYVDNVRACIHRAAWAERDGLVNLHSRCERSSRIVGQREVIEVVSAVLATDPGPEADVPARG